MRVVIWEFEWFGYVHAITSFCGRLGLFRSARIRLSWRFTFITGSDACLSLMWTHPSAETPFTCSDFPTENSRFCCCSSPPLLFCWLFWHPWMMVMTMTAICAYASGGESRRAGVLVRVSSLHIRYVSDLGLHKKVAQVWRGKICTEIRQKIWLSVISLLMGT